MSNTDPATIARALYDALNRRDLATSRALNAPDAEWVFVHSGEKNIGGEGYARWVENFIQTFPDSRVEVTHLHAAGEWVTVEFTSRATHAPTGKKIELKVCEVLRIEGGLIRGVRVYLDSAAIARQLAA